MSDLDNDLRRADPARNLDDASAAAITSASWARIRSSSSQPLPRRRRWQVLLPAGIAVAAVSTGAAIAVPVVLDAQEPDAQITISYTTLSGVGVDCTWAVTVGADQTAADLQVADVLASTDWDGVGQDIYDYAIANPRVPQSDETWTNDSPETRDAISFKLAIVPMVERRLPAELHGSATGWRSTDTCTGPFR